MDIKLNTTDYEHLLKLYSEWNRAEDNIPANEWERGYKHRNQVAQKKWRTFSAFCEKHSLQSVQVATDFGMNKFEHIKAAITVNGITFEERGETLTVLAPNHSSHSVFLDKAFEVARQLNVTYRGYGHGSNYHVKFTIK